MFKELIEKWKEFNNLRVFEGYSSEISVVDLYRGVEKTYFRNFGGFMEWLENNQ